MKIQCLDISRFLQLVRKTWKSKTDDDFQAVVFTVIESNYSIAMAKDGLLLTYLCNPVDLEISEQSIVLPFAFLLDDATGNSVMELTKVVENGEGYVLAKLLEEHVQSVRMWPALDSPQYHLLQDLAWHTIDERQLIAEFGSQPATVPIANR